MNNKYEFIRIKLKFSSLLLFQPSGLTNVEQKTFVFLKKNKSIYKT